MFLVKHGYIVIKKNYYASRFGEIDLISLKNGVYHFIEVKSVLCETYRPSENVSYKKINSLKKAVLYYLANEIKVSFNNNYNRYINFQIDLITVVFIKKTRTVKFEYLENINIMN